MKPFLKWAGNKVQLLSEIEPLVPESKNYFELFLGSGSVFFHLCEKRDWKYICLNDINDKLITTYEMVKERPYDLIEELKILENNYIRKNFKTQKGIYQRERDKFNKATDKLEIASKFIFLNKTCYGGLYRVNDKGDFNTSFLRPKKLDFGYDNILKASKELQNVKLYSNSFESFNEIKKDSFFFLDPPYYKQFNSYDKKGNNLPELLSFCKMIDENGGKFLLCNSSYTKVKRTFDGFNISKHDVTRHIKGYKKTKELFIYNYEVK